jgi:hypothetical protein
VIVALTRDSVAMGDDTDAPHTGTIEVADDASLADVARAIVRAPRYLAAVMSGATWYIRHGDAAVVFGDQWEVPFLLTVGDAEAPLGRMDTLHVRYARQDAPEDVAEHVGTTLRRF